MHQAAYEVTISHVNQLWVTIHAGVVPGGSIGKVVEGSSTLDA